MKFFIPIALLWVNLATTIAEVVPIKPTAVKNDASPCPILQGRQTTRQPGPTPIPPPIGPNDFPPFDPVAEEDIACIFPRNWIPQRVLVGPGSTRLAADRINRRQVEFYQDFERDTILEFPLMEVGEMFQSIAYYAELLVQGGFTFGTNLAFNGRQTAGYQAENSEFF
ncbi:hypothetical protein F5Y16DRAFT_396513 [Xylariaceae sp. FL0255]|nr:hypothetical protein F5Y16DRAFT_396513 [Xylariaceae sp. FL0255]